MQTAFSQKASNQRQLLNYLHWQTDLTSVGCKKEIMPSLKFVLSKFKAVSRPNQGTCTFPSGTQLRGGRGMVTIWEVIHPTYSQIMSSAAGEWQRELWPHLLTSPLLCLARCFTAIESLLQTIWVKKSLSLIFYFYFQCIREDEQNAQITLCDHRVICKSCFWGTHGSLGFLWYCLKHCRHVLTGFPNPSPLQGEAQHTVCCIWLPKAMGSTHRGGRCPCLITVIILLV